MLYGTFKDIHLFYKQSFSKSVLLFSTNTVFKLIQFLEMYDTFVNNHVIIMRIMELLSVVYNDVLLSKGVLLTENADNPIITTFYDEMSAIEQRGKTRKKCNFL